jgi:hypothetical protein
MSIRHPTREALGRWLNAEGDVEPGVDRHLSSCERCAAIVEELAQAADVADAADSGATAETGTMGDALALVLAPPPDLADRLEKRVAAKLSSRQVLNVVADLFGAGFETTRLLFIEDDPIGNAHDDE